MSQRLIVCLTFDFDVWSGWTARGMSTPTPVSRGEFCLVGARRILRLLREQGITSTWFIPGVVIDTHEPNCAEVAEAGHEIGHHGYSHSVPASMSAQQEEREMVRAIESIRRLSGRPPRGYRSPAWDLSPITIDLLLRHGFDYDSSMMGDEFTPYYARRGDEPGVDEPFHFGEPTSILEMPISWTLDDYPHFEFVRAKDGIMPGLANAQAVLENWINDFAYMARYAEWGALTYTFHPYVIGRGHRMLILEKLIDELRTRGAVFLTLEQAAQEFRRGQAAVPCAPAAT